ncbi:alpha/beta fold hydrolase [Xanthomonas campestris pv. phormiicola]|nr:alpha/beta fold hydrolase [Xanthomonas campestris pv. phormiicola]UYC16287.1 alpha/beta fold hydrolase [Xanthomonas campestris pv. phormiicola]
MSAYTEENTSRFIDAGAIKLRYHEAGAGEHVLVLLHGGGPGASAWSNYRSNIGHLAEKFRVLAFDAPHYGESDKPMSAYQDTDYYAETIGEALHKLGVFSADFVGNSMGGTIALTLALTRPALVRRMVLMGPGGSSTMFTPQPTEGVKLLGSYYQGEGPTRAKLEAAIRIMVHDQSLVTPELLEQRFAASTKPELLKKREWKGHAMHDLWTRLNGLPHPALLVYGKEDRVIPWDSSLLLLRLLPNASLHVFPQCGHWAQLEKAAQFNALVTDYVTQADV